MGLMGGRAGDDEREERGGVCAGGFVAPAAEDEEAAAAGEPGAPAAAADVDGGGAFDARGETASVCIVRPGIVSEAGVARDKLALVLFVSLVVWFARFGLKRLDGVSLVGFGPGGRRERGNQARDGRQSELQAEGAPCVAVPRRASWRGNSVSFRGSLVQQGPFSAQGAEEKLRALRLGGRVRCEILG